MLEGPRTLETPWAQWSGGSSDLLALLRHMEATAAPRVREYIQHAVTREREALQRAQSRLGRVQPEPSHDVDGAAQLHTKLENQRLEADVQEAQATLDAAISRATLDSTMTMAVRMKKTDRQRITGSAEELASWLRTRSFERVEFNIECGMDHSLTLTFERRYGAALVVTSINSEWAVATYAKLREHLKEQTPKLAFVRNDYFLIISLSVTFSLTLSWILLRLLASVPENDPQYLPLLLVSQIASCLFGIALGFICTRWVLHLYPAAELVSASPKPRFLVLLGVFGTASLSVAVSLLVG